MPEDSDEPTISAALLAFHDPANARVLNIGYGDGKRTIGYLERAGAVIGIDPSRKVLEEFLAPRATPSYSRISLLQARAGALPFGSGTFDIAPLSWSL